MKKYLVFVVIFFALPAFSQVSEQELSASWNRIVSQFGEAVRSKHAKALSLDIWDATGAGFVQCHEQACEVILFNGLLQTEGFRKKHLDTILCHEVGHLLGMDYSNPSKLADIHFSTYAAEGEADYFSSNICLPLIWRQDLPLADEHPNFPKITEACFNRYADPIRRRICTLSAEAAFFTISLGWQVPTNLDGMDSSIQPPELGTNFNQPSANCRFSSIVSGALNLERPACWYVPDEKIPSRWRVPTLDYR